MADATKQFTVLWMQRGREKQSAVMTEPEADKLVRFPGKTAASFQPISRPWRG